MFGDRPPVAQRCRHATSSAKTRISSGASNSLKVQGATLANPVNDAVS